MVRNVLIPALVSQRSVSERAAFPLDGIDAPIAFCSDTGTLEAATPAALALMQRLGVVDRVPGPVPPELWTALQRRELGDAIEWRPTGNPRSLLGCSRYATENGFFLLMREVSDKHADLARRLYRQRLDTTRHLVAGIAHELRSSLASIVYTADFLDVSGPDLTPRAMRSALQDIGAASRRLQLTVDGMLDHALLGPSVSVAVDLKNAMERSTGLLRSLYREDLHAVRMDLRADACTVRGNPLNVEQIFVTLLLNAAEASDGKRTVHVTSELAVPPGRSSDTAEQVRVRVWDDGPGVPSEIGDLVFDPFFSTKQHGTGIGLTGAREAARALDGDLILQQLGSGACFDVYLPRSDVAA